MKQESLIRRFVTGQMDTGEYASFREELIDDPSVKEDLIIEQLMYEYRNEELRKQLRASAATKSTTSGHRNYLLILAAILLLGAIGYYWSLNRSRPPVSTFVDQYLSERSIAPSQLMDDKVTTTDAWEAAAAQYSAGNYDAALAVLLRADELSSEQRLYLGLCHIYKGNPDYDKAREVLDGLQASEDIVVYDQAIWYGALINIKLDREEQAKVQLQRIVDDQLWKHQEASRLLEILN